jgi:hypothetical protein
MRSHSREKRPSAPPFLPVWMLPSGSHWTDFRKFLYLWLLWKSVEKPQNLFKIGYLTWRPKYVLFPATLTPHKRVTFEGNVIGLLGWPEEVQILCERGKMLHYMHTANLFAGDAKAWFTETIRLARTESQYLKRNCSYYKAGFQRECIYVNICKRCGVCLEVAGRHFESLPWHKIRCPARGKKRT